MCLAMIYASAAAWPSTRGTSMSSEHVGFQPSSMRRVSSSSAVGLWSQTATAASSPNQDTPKTIHRESGSGKNRS